MKNVVFCGMPRALERGGAGLRDRHRTAEDRGGRGALVDLGGDAGRVVPVAPRRFGEARLHQGLDDRGVGGRDDAVLVRECGGAHVGFRDGQGEPGCVDQAERVVGGHAVLQRVDLVGRVRARVDDVEVVGEAPPEVDVGREVEQTVDGLDVELVVVQLDDEHHDLPGPADVAGGHAQLVAVRARGLETVVAVGEHDRRTADERADARDAIAVVDRTQLVGVAVGVGAGREHGVGVEQLGEARGQAQAPDGIDVGAGRAQQREPVRLGLGDGALVGQQARIARFGERERSDDAPGVTRLAVRAPELHAIGVQTRCGIVREHA